MAKPTSVVAPLEWNMAFQSKCLTHKNVHILVQLLPSLSLPWEATKTNERGLTTVYTSPTPVDLVNLTVSFRDYDTACAAFYVLYQMGDAWVTERKIEYGVTMGLSREAIRYLAPYSHTREIGLPKVCEIILHRVEDILDSGSCVSGTDSEGCNATYVALELDDSFRDPISFLDEFIRCHEGEGLCIIEHPQVIVKLRDEMRSPSQTPRPVGKCQKCIYRAKEDLDRILEALLVYLPSMLIGDDDAVVMFHDHVFR